MGHDLDSRTVSAKHAAARAGITYRQLDYWCRTRLITPFVEASGQGSRRLFTERQVLTLTALGALADTVGINNVDRAFVDLLESLEDWTGLCPVPGQDGIVQVALDLDEISRTSELV